MCVYMYIYCTTFSLSIYLLMWISVASVTRLSWRALEWTWVCRDSFSYTDFEFFGYIPRRGSLDPMVVLGSFCTVLHSALIYRTWAALLAVWFFSADAPSSCDLQLLGASTVPSASPSQLLTHPLRSFWHDCNLLSYLFFQIQNIYCTKM